jgi:hypothetical protein
MRISIDKKASVICKCDQLFGEKVLIKFDVKSVIA